MDFVKRAQEIQEEVVANRRYLHQHPETGHDLDNTVRFVKEKLTEIGCVPQDCGDHGVTALIGGKKPGKCILIRADMDALPMKEESGLPFAASCDNAAHTCGHDTHTAMLLGAAKLLKEMESEIPGTVKLMFQPAEEKCSGAESMVNAGILENPKVDAAFGVHIFAAMPSGMIFYKDGPMFASADIFEIQVKGHGGHGSMPEKSVDPILVGAKIVDAMQTINAREIAPGDTGALTVGTFHAGDAFNIIPDTASLSGTIRTFDNGVRDFMKKRIVEIAEGTAQTFRAQASVNFPSGTGVVVVDPAVSSVIGGAVKKMIGEKMVVDNIPPISGSEDFAYVSDAVPSVFFGLGAQPTDYDAYPQHNAKIRFNEDSFATGVAVYAGGAVAWLEANPA